MKKISKISASFLTISSIACIFWMGSYLLRMFLTYQLFDETITSYKTYVNEQNISEILITLNPAVVTTFVLFIVFLIFYFLFLFTSRLNLRKNGWLFIITVLIVVTAPFEIYLMTIDYQIFSSVNGGVFQHTGVISLVIKRLKNLSSFPIIELLSYCTVVFLAIFKPMTREEKK
jgi:hypothetical protein